MAIKYRKNSKISFGHLILAENKMTHVTYKNLPSNISTKT